MTERITTGFLLLPARPLPAGQRGFTLVEMMTALLILAILVTVGIPSFSNATLGSRLSTDANELLASAYLARSEAMKRNLEVTLCVSANGTSCAGSGGWEQGWIVIEEGSGDVIARYPARRSGFKVIAKNAGNAAFYQMEFQPSGVGVELDTGSVPVTLTVCRGAPDVGKQERVVTVSNTGKPRITSTEAGACS